MAAALTPSEEAQAQAVAQVPLVVPEATDPGKTKAAKKKVERSSG